MGVARTNALPQHAHSPHPAVPRQGFDSLYHSGELFLLYKIILK